MQMERKCKRSLHVYSTDTPVKSVDSKVYTLILEHSFTVSSPLGTQHKKASNHHANLPLEMYSFTL